MKAEEVRMLFAYDAWANARALDACSVLTPERFTKDLGSSFPSVRDTLAHIMAAQWIWNERFHNRPTTGLPKADQYTDLAVLGERWAEVQRDLLGFVNRLSDGDLERTFEYRDTKGNAHRSVYREVLQHLVNHGTYHRGQVTTLLRQLGVKPVNTDLMVFYRELASQPAK